jgi:2-polyprenyl-3-methyl-5-hydroxy-6-metoxy-1,4-benzoquinol methylase
MRRAQTEKAINAEVERLVPCPASIIDFSCGRGHLVRRLREKGYDVVGTNYSVYEDADRCHHSKYFEYPIMSAFF